MGISSKNADITPLNLLGNYLNVKKENSAYKSCCSIGKLTDGDTVFQPVASTINTLAGALYKVFCASPDPARKEMRQACFDYLSLGGVFSTGPVSLLSGLNPRPLSLVLHFFAVAVFGVSRLLLPFPTPKRMWIGARLITVRISIYHCVSNIRIHMHAYIFQIIPYIACSHKFSPYFFISFTNF